MTDASAFVDDVAGELTPRSGVRVERRDGGAAAVRYEPSENLA